MTKKILYLGLTIFTIGLGLASRKFMFIFPEIIAPYIGDALWAAMVYFGFRFLFTNASLIKCLVLAFTFSFSIEFSQLYQADWINQIRATILGSLILGHGFLFQDLISYTIGIFLSYRLDLFLKLKMCFK